MKTLHIFKTEPDSNIKTLMDILARDEEATTFAMYEGEPDYPKLVDLIFEGLGLFHGLLDRLEHRVHIG